MEPMRKQSDENDCETETYLKTDEMRSVNELNNRFVGSSKNS
jgi:hypothetical protein